MKKNVITLILLSVLSSSVFAGTTTTTVNSNVNTVKNETTKETTKDIILKQSPNIIKMYNKDPQFFETSKRLKSDMKIEDEMIASLKKIYIEKKDTFKKSDYNLTMNKLFVDALKTGNNKLADVILYDSGAKIDVNFRSDSPNNTPLSALATSFAYDGGDIEYFIKLVNMGANINEKTLKNNIPLMSLAAMANNYKIVLYLTMLGQNPMHLDDLDFYPLDYAVRNNAYQTTILLTKVIDTYTKELKKDKK